MVAFMLNVLHDTCVGEISARWHLVRVCRLLRLREYRCGKAFPFFNACARLTGLFKYTRILIMSFSNQTLNLSVPHVAELVSELHKEVCKIQKDHKIVKFIHDNEFTINDDIYSRFPTIAMSDSEISAVLDKSLQNCYACDISRAESQHLSASFHPFDPVVSSTVIYIDYVGSQYPLIKNCSNNEWNRKTIPERAAIADLDPRQAPRKVTLFTECTFTLRSPDIYRIKDYKNAFSFNVTPETFHERIRYWVGMLAPFDSLSCRLYDAICVRPHFNVGFGVSGGFDLPPHIFRDDNVTPKPWKQVVTHQMIYAPSTIKSSYWVLASRQLWIHEQRHHQQPVTLQSLEEPIVPHGGNFSRTVDNINVASENFRDASESLNETLNTAHESVKTTTDSFNAILDKIAAYFPSETVGSFLRAQGLNVLVLIADTITYFYDSTVRTTAATVKLLMRYAGSFGMSLPSVFSLGEYITNLFSKQGSPNGIEEPVNTHAGDHSTSAGTAIAAIIGTLLAGTSLSPNGLKQAEGIGRFFNTMTTAGRNLEGLIVNVFQALPSVVREWLAFLVPGQDLYLLMLAPDSDFSKLIQESDELHDVRGLPGNVYTPAYLARVETLVVSLRELHMRLLKVSNVRPSVLQAVVFHLRRGEKLLYDSQMFADVGGRRITPYCICLYGEPGVGKSTLASSLVDSLCPAGTEPRMRSYTRNAVDPYWSGYFGQFAVIMDDCAQEVQDWKDVLELFAMVSNNTHYPPMASLDSDAIGKKGTKFSSHMVVLCTNNPFPQPTKVFNWEAIYRRRNVLIKVRVTPETLNPRTRLPDPTRMKDDGSHLRFDLRIPTATEDLPGSYIRTDMTCAQLIEFVHNDMQQHLSREKFVVENPSENIFGAPRPVVLTDPDVPAPDIIVEDDLDFDPLDGVNVHGLSTSKYVSALEDFFRKDDGLRSQRMRDWDDSSMAYVDIMDEEDLIEQARCYENDVADPTYFGGGSFPYNLAAYALDDLEEDYSAPTTIDRSSTLDVAAVAFAEMRCDCAIYGFGHNMGVHHSLLHPKFLDASHMHPAFVYPHPGNMNFDDFERQSGHALQHCRLHPSYKYFINSIMHFAPRAQQDFWHKQFVTYLETCVRIWHETRQHVPHGLPVGEEVPMPHPSLQEFYHLAELFWFKNYMSIFQANLMHVPYSFITAQQLIAMCQKLGTFRVFAEEQQRLMSQRGLFLESHPILNFILNSIGSFATACALVVTMKFIWRWLFPEKAKKTIKLTEQSYERSQGNPLTMKRAKAEYTHRTPAALRVQGAVDLLLGNDQEVPTAQRDKTILEVLTQSYEFTPDEAREYLNSLYETNSRFREVLTRRGLKKDFLPIEVEDLKNKVSSLFENDRDVRKILTAVKHDDSNIVQVHGLFRTVLHDEDEIKKDAVMKVLCSHVDFDTAHDVLESLEPLRERALSIHARLSPEDSHKLRQETSIALASFFTREPDIVHIHERELTNLEMVCTRSVATADYSNFRHQGASDQMCIDQVYTRIIPQLGNLFCTGATTHSRITAFPIRGSVLMVPYHFFAPDGVLRLKGTEITFQGAHQYQCKFAFDPANLVRVLFDGEPSDVSLYYENTNRLRQFKDSVNKFILESDLPALTGFQCMLVSVMDDIPTISHGDASLVRSSRFTIEAGRQKKIARAFHYNIPTLPGSCGSILAASKSTLERKFCGMHFGYAFDTDAGYSVPVTQEALEAALALFDEKPVTGTMIPPIALQSFVNARALPSGTFSIFGTVPQSLAIVPVEKTQLRPSILFDRVYTHTNAPSVLKGNDSRLREELRTGKFSVLANSASKYGKPSKPLDPEVLKVCVDDVINILLACRNHHEKRVLTFPEVINGNPQIIGFEPINMLTSAGYPYVMHTPPGQKGKKWLFTTDPETGEMTSVPFLTAIFLEREAAAMKLERYPSIWTDCAKDELRPLEKVKDGKTRTFSIAPVDFTMVFRKYFLSFCAFFMESRDQHFSSIGMNPESHEWTQMFERLFDVSTLGIAGDFGSWDGRLGAQLIHACTDVIDAWYASDPAFYRPEHRNVRRTLTAEVNHTTVIMMNLVYGQHGGNPSGNPLTAILNTICNALLMRYAYLKIVPTNIASLSILNKNSYMKFYGDDHLIAVTPMIGKFFNMHSLSIFMASIGKEYTTADKKDVKTGNPLEPLLKLSYLKRHTRKDGVKYLPLMSKDTIHGLVNWIRECDDPTHACIDNVNTALRFMFFYGQMPFEEMRKKCLAGFVKVGVAADLHTYGYLSNMFSSAGAFSPLTCYNSFEQEAYDDIDITDYLSRYQEEIEAEKEGSPVRLQSSEEPTGATKSKKYEEVPETPVTTTKGIVLSDAGSSSVVNSNRGDGLNLNDSRFSATHQNWTLKNTAERWAYVTTANWLTNYNTNTIIYKAICPQQLLVTALNTVGFAYFNNWRGSIKIRMAVDGTPFHAGSCVACFLPHVNDNMEAQLLSSPINYTTIQHGFLDASKQNTLELNIPFAHFRDFITLADSRANAVEYNNLGRVYIIVLNPLRVGSAASSIPITIHVSLIDSEFVAPSGQTTLPAVRMQSAILGGMAMSAFGHMINKILPRNTTGDALDAKSEGTGMDNPNNTVQPPQVITRGFGYTSNAVQIDSMERIALDPSKQEKIRLSDFNVGCDEMDVHYLLKEPSFVGYYNWTSSADVNTIIYQRQIMPFDEALSIPNPGSTVAVTMLGYISSMCTEWRGDLKMTIQLVGSQFVKGKLWVGFHHGFHAPPTDLNTALAQTGIVLDLSSEQRTFTFNIPFISLTKWLHVPNGITDDTRDWTKESCGTMSIRVLSKLTNPGNVADLCYVNVYVGAGDNFQLAHPGLGNASLVPVYIQSSEELIGTEAQTLVSPEVSKKTTAIVSVGKPVPLSHSHMNETFTNLRDLLKRWSPLYSGVLEQIEGETGDDVSVPSIIIFSVDHLFTTVPNYTPEFAPYIHIANRSSNMAKISSLYRWRRGSLKFRVDFFDPNTTTTQHIRGYAAYYPKMRIPQSQLDMRDMRANFTRSCPSLFNQADLDSNPSKLQPDNGHVYTSALNSCLEFEIPYESCYNFNLNRNLAVPFEQWRYGDHFSPGMIVIGAWSTGEPTHDTATNKIMANIWFKVGDDFHFGGLIGVPLLRNDGWAYGTTYDYWPDSYPIAD